MTRCVNENDALIIRLNTVSPDMLGNPASFTCRTVDEALANDCWPAPEVGINVNSDELGDLGLTEAEEDAIVAFMLASWRLSKLAVLMFVPYLAWVSFAGALNFALLQLNS